MFLGKDVLKICSKFTGEHPCRIMVSKKLRIMFTNVNGFIRVYVGTKYLVLLVMKNKIQMMIGLDIL